jgi:hypothetical protein
LKSLPHPVQVEEKRVNARIMPMGQGVGRKSGCRVVDPGLSPRWKIVGLKSLDDLSRDLLPKIVRVYVLFSSKAVSLL